MIPPQARSTLTDNNLNSVTCVSDADCWAVGAYRGDGGAYQTLIEHWNGRAWWIVDSPNTDSKLINFLYSVTCRSTSDCWAVGGSVTASADVNTLTEHWDGSSWTIVASPNATASGTVGGVLNILYSVACSAQQCWAVGYSANGPADQTLIEQWNGLAWSVVISPNVGALSNQLVDVICVSDSDCLAVGGFYDGKTNQTLVERWNGTLWTIAISPSSLPTSDSGLTSASCISSTDCWAVGFSKDANGVYQSLTQHWDGTLWTVVSSPSLTQDNGLESVNCLSTSNCSAVGKYIDASLYITQTHVEHWDGNSWSIVNSPDSSSTEGNDLAGVACGSASNCWAVGLRKDGIFDQNLIEHWNGSSWNIVFAPDHPPNETWNTFTGVSCVSASDCWAVGYYLVNFAVDQTLIEHWNGSSWTIVPSANTNQADVNHLLAITCVSTSDCWAVGEFQASGHQDNTLIEHWDGNSWSVIPSPNANTSDLNQLRGVTCASASECWAVGIHYDSSANTFRTLIEQWDGISWTVISSPDTDPTQSNLLNNVSCASPTECWAVGYYFNGSGLQSPQQTLVEEWNGTSWTIVTSPNSSTSDFDVLNSVTCASISDCWAVGDYGSLSSGLNQTLIEHWNGTAWTIITSPNALTNTDDFLHSVTCTSATECWAVGYYDLHNTGLDRTLIELWDGNTWSVASSPNTSSSSSNDLKTVTCTSASQCWAVGNYTKDGAIQALTEFIAPIELISVVSRKVHGNAGSYDVDLTNGNGIECRSGTTNGDYSIIFTFRNSLTNVDGATITTGTGKVLTSSAIGPNANQYTVNLSGVTNAQRLIVTLSNVTDSVGNFGYSVKGVMGVLVGDVNGSGRVDSADVTSVRQQTLQPITAANFRNDINASGRIDSADVTIAREQALTTLP